MLRRLHIGLTRSTILASRKHISLSPYCPLCPARAPRVSYFVRWVINVVRSIKCSNVAPKHPLSTAHALKEPHSEFDEAFIMWVLLQKKSILSTSSPSLSHDHSPKVSNAGVYEVYTIWASNTLNSRLTVVCPLLMLQRYRTLDSTKCTHCGL